MPPATAYATGSSTRLAASRQAVQARSWPRWSSTQTPSQRPLGSRKRSRPQARSSCRSTRRRRPTSPLEHAIVSSALRRLGVKLTALAPRFPGHFEKGIDYRGSVQEFAAAVAVHAALAEALGPYKLSLHSGSDKLSVYEAFAHASGGRFHVKTAGTSYLEALRLAARTDTELMRLIWTESRDAFGAARRTYEMAATLEDAPPAELSDEELPGLLDDDTARQILHVNFGGVIGTPELRDRLAQVLAQDDGDRYAELLEHHFAAHLSLL